MGGDHAGLLVPSGAGSPVCRSHISVAGLKPECNANRSCVWGLGCLVFGVAFREGGFTPKGFGENARVFGLGSRGRCCLSAPIDP